MSLLRPHVRLYLLIVRKTNITKLSACHPKVFTDTRKQDNTPVKHNLFYYAVTLLGRHVSTHFKSSSGPF